jgi:hypothetical protein
MDEPTAPSDPWPARRNGALGVLVLHLAFIGATAGVQAAVAPEPSGDTLLGIWIRWIGLLQGIYVLPAVLSVALMQRWQLMMGMLAAAAVTAAASALGALLA